MDDDKKTQIFTAFLGYLSNTNPIMLLFHLLYIIIVCAILTFGYVVAFHWTSLLHIYEDAHSIQTFSTNLKTSVELDNDIRNSLERLNRQVNGMRTYVYRYHNGLAAVSGVPFFFQSMTHEVISPGASRLLPYEQRIPVGISMNINHEFLHNTCATIKNADADPRSQDYYFFQSRAAKAMIRCPIYMNNGDLFGFVGVDFYDNPEKLETALGAVTDAAASVSKLFANQKR